MLLWFKGPQDEWLLPNSEERCREFTPTAVVRARRCPRCCASRRVELKVRNGQFLQIRGVLEGRTEGWMEGRVKGLTLSNRTLVMLNTARTQNSQTPASSKKTLLPSLKAFLGQIIYRPSLQFATVTSKLVILGLFWTVVHRSTPHVQTHHTSGRLTHLVAPVWYSGLQILRVTVPWNTILMIPLSCCIQSKHIHDSVWSFEIISSKMRWPNASRNIFSL